MLSAEDTNENTDGKNDAESFRVVFMYARRRTFLTDKRWLL